LPATSEHLSKTPNRTVAHKPLAPELLAELPRPKQGFDIDPDAGELGVPRVVRLCADMLGRLNDNATGPLGLASSAL
jgi:hypothetical protein